MSKKFYYDYNLYPYDNIILYINNKEYWDNNDFILFNSLKFDEGPIMGPNRKKLKYFFEYVFKKIYNN